MAGRKVSARQVFDTMSPPSTKKASISFPWPVQYHKWTKNHIFISRLLVGYVKEFPERGEKEIDCR